MPKTDLSITPPSFVEFAYNGWPEEKKNELEIALRDIAGITAVNKAGAGSHIHVHFAPALTNREELVATVCGVADKILPGHNFSA